jgi:phosphoglycolate phosphatase
MNSAAQPIKAIAFDLDGTLVDSAPDIGHALNCALRQAGLPIFDVNQVREWIGDGPDVLIDRALKSLGAERAAAASRVELRQAFDAATFDAPLAYGSVFDGILLMLQQLAPRWPLVVITNKPTVLARAVLDAAGLLPQFTAVFGADEARLRKPAPALLEQAAHELKVLTQHLLMVGDGPADMKAASAAGAPAALVGWGYAHAQALEHRPRWCIEHPRQLHALVNAA